MGRTHLRLPRTRTIESSGHGIKAEYDSNSDKKPWEEDRNQDDSSDNTGKCVEKHAEGVYETKLRTNELSRLKERTGQHIVDCVDVFRKAVHNTANRLRTTVGGGRILTKRVVRTVVSKKDIGLCITRLMPSFQDVR